MVLDLQSQRTRSAFQQDLRDRFADDNVAMVKADWTHRNPQITQMLQAFGRSGVPLRAVSRGQLDAPIVLPELISEEIVRGTESAQLQL